jgi:hypothetical protein
VNAFKYLGGVPHEILYDNIKTVVIRRLLPIGKSKMNEKFMDFAGYYSLVPRLCRPSKARTKGKVESSVKFVSYGFLMGRKFNYLDELNNQCLDWLDEINSQTSQATGEIPFERLKRENLMLITAIPEYDTSETWDRKVPKDCLINFQGNRYSVPPQYIGKTVIVKKTTKNTLKIYHKDNFICEHKIVSGKRHIIYLLEHKEQIFKISCRYCSKKPKTKAQKFLGNEYLGKYPVVENRRLDYYDKF